MHVLKKVQQGRQACSRLLAAAGWLLRFVVLLWMSLLWSERTGFTGLECAAV